MPVGDRLERWPGRWQQTAYCQKPGDTTVTLHGLTVDTKGTKNTKNTKFGGSRYGLAGTPACGFPRVSPTS